jgi:hypothetical protein
VSGLLPYIVESADATGTLTREDIERAAEAIRERTGFHPCKRGAHLVSPKALYRAGAYVCADCGALVDVPIPLSEAVA